MRAIPVAAFVFLIATSSFAAPPEKSTHRLFAGTGQGVKNAVPYPPGTPLGPAKTLAIGNPFGIECADGQVWITSVDDHCIYRGSQDGKRFKRVVGNGLAGYSGDGGPAVDARFNWPHEVRVDGEGNLFVADTRNHVIRRVDGATGIVTTLAGDGKPGFEGEGDRGANVQFKQPHSVVLDGTGGLLVADTVNHRIRRIDLETGIVRTISGTGQRKLPTDGQLANNSPLYGPRSLAVDADSIWVALREGIGAIGVDDAGHGLDPHGNRSYDSWRAKAGYADPNRGSGAGRRTSRRRPAHSRYHDKCEYPQGIGF